MDSTLFDFNEDGTGLPSYGMEAEVLGISENNYDFGQLTYPATPSDFGDMSEVLDKAIEEHQSNENGSDLINFDFLIDNGTGNFTLPEQIMPIPSQLTVAPAMVQYTYNAQGDTNSTAPVTVVAPPLRSRRKSMQDRRSSLDDTPVFAETIDLKPSEDVLQLGLAGGNRGKKRPLSTTLSAAPQTPSSCKRIKKYELHDNEDPSVRNARAAKANRDKKKKEVTDLKAENARLMTENHNLTQENLQNKALLRKMASEFRRVRQQQQAATGIVQVQGDLSRFLGSMVPALGQGGFPVPTITLAPGFITPEAGTRSITTQYNLDMNTMTVSCPVVPAGQSTWTGQMPQ